MESRRKRVEQKGRFTITEIIPGSPYSPRVASPSFQDDEVSVADFPSPVGDNGEMVATIQPQPAPPQQQLKPVESNGIEKDPASNGALEPALKMEEPPETHTQPPEEVLVPPPPIEESIASAPQMEASAVDSSSEVLISTPASATAVMGSPSRKFSSPKKARDGMQRTRRVKRRGRFTIIELASDSPTSRKNSDDLYDHRFVTTTSIGGASVESAPHPDNQLSRSLDNSERRTKPRRATRSMPRLRQASSMRRSRRRSESPTREFIESVDMVDPSGNQQQQQDATEYAALQALPATESTDHLANASMASAIAVSGGTNGSGLVTSVVTPDTETNVTVAPGSVGPASPSSQLIKVPDTNGSVVGLSQTPVTISSAQFLQQQQTIASLIRQQHDLKQIISVLQEQQQQLMTIPSQISELKRQRAISNGETRDGETRELYMKIDKLTRANESLHALLNAAERDARHHTLEIECLSEENDELRHRFGQLESRYIDERKQSFVLEEELQRLRTLSMAQQKQQLRLQQQQGQKVNNA